MRNVVWIMRLDRPVDFSVAENEKFCGMVSRSTLWGTFKNFDVLKKNNCRP